MTSRAWLTGLNVSWIEGVFPTDISEVIAYPPSTFKASLEMVKEKWSFPHYMTIRSLTCEAMILLNSCEASFDLHRMPVKPIETTSLLSTRSPSKYLLAQDAAISERIAVRAL